MTVETLQLPVTHSVGAEATYAVPGEYHEASDIVVSLSTDGGATWIEQSQGVDYDLAPEGPAYAGGTVTPLVNWPDGAQITIHRATKPWQEYSPPVAARAYETALDRAVMAIQDNAGALSRTLRAAPQENPLAPLQSKATRADGIMGWDGDGNPTTAPVKPTDLAAAVEAWRSANPPSIITTRRAYSSAAIADAAVLAGHIDPDTIIEINRYHADWSNGGGVLVANPSAAADLVPLYEHPTLALPGGAVELTLGGVRTGGVTAAMRDQNARIIEHLFTNAWASRLSVADRSKQNVEASAITATTAVDAGEGSSVGAFDAPETTIEHYGTGNALLLAPTHQWLRHARVVLGGLISKDANASHVLYFNSAGASLDNPHIFVENIVTANPQAHCVRFNCYDDDPTNGGQGSLIGAVSEGYFGAGNLRGVRNTQTATLAVIEVNGSFFNNARVDFQRYDTFGTPARSLIMRNKGTISAPSGVTLLPSLFEQPSGAAIVLNGFRNTVIEELSLRDLYTPAVESYVQFGPGANGVQTDGVLVKRYERTFGPAVGPHYDFEGAVKDLRILRGGAGQTSQVLKVNAAGMSGTLEGSPGASVVNATPGVFTVNNNERHEVGVMSALLVEKRLGPTLIITGGQLAPFGGGAALTAFDRPQYILRGGGTITALPAPTYEGQEVTLIPHHGVNPDNFDLNRAALVGSATGLTNVAPGQSLTLRGTKLFNAWTHPT